MKPFDVQLTENFRLSEFIQSATAESSYISEQYLVNTAVVENLRGLCLFLLQPVRKHFGKVVIRSGYRCKVLNKILRSQDAECRMRGMSAEFWCKDMDGAWQYLQSKSFTLLIRGETCIYVSYDEANLKREIIDLRGI